MVTFEVIEDSDDEAIERPTSEDEQIPDPADGAPTEQPVPEPPAPEPVPDPAVPEILPARGDTVKLKDLVSSPGLNGKRAEVLSFVTEGGNSGRYKVEVKEGEDGKTRTLAVRPRNMSVLPRGGGGDDDEDRRNLVHVLVPCHVSDRRQIDRFDQSVRSLALQTGPCRFYVGVSGDGVLRRRALLILRAAASSEEGGLHRWTVLNDDPDGEMDTRKSQFQHLKALLKIHRMVWSRQGSRAWLVFLSNGDMFHPEHIRFFQESLAKMKETCPAGKAFYCGSKALVSEVAVGSKYGRGKAFPLDRFINDQQKIPSDVVEVATSYRDNVRKDTVEFRDFCVHSDLLHTFCNITPDEILGHRSCGARFLDALNNITPHPPRFEHPQHPFLTVHYCVRRDDRRAMYGRLDLERLGMEGPSAEDRMIESQCTLRADKICAMRHCAEECVVQAINTSSKGLDRARGRLMDWDDNHRCTREGNMVWKSNMEKFGGYFTEELARENMEWWEKLDSAEPEKKEKTKRVTKEKLDDDMMDAYSLLYGSQ